VTPYAGSSTPANSSSAPPPTANNPYKNIGIAPSISVYPTDLFGNEWSTLQESKKLPDSGYTDPVISLKQLPHLHLDYEFSGSSGSGQLNINFNWIPPTYTFDKKAKNNCKQREGDLEAYAKAYYQVSANMSATIKTSMLSNVVSDSSFITTIQSNILNIYEAIASGGKTPSAPTLTPITTAVNATITGFNTDQIYPLTVSLQLTRDSSIDPQFKDDEKVNGSNIYVSPLMSIKKGKTTKTLDAFVTKFQTAFGDNSMQIAVGADKSNETSGKAQQVWVVRYGTNGINFTIDGTTAEYFAPRPLSTTLISNEKVKVPKTGPYPKEEVTVNNVDLDSEMRYFLKAVDNMFTPEMIVPASLINPTALSALSAYKEKIAGNLSSYVVSLTSSENNDSHSQSSAIKKYKDECLIELSNFYKMSSVVVLPVTATLPQTPAPGDPINVFGSSVNTGTPTKEFSLTTGKTDLASSGSPMAIGLFPKKISEFSHYTADLNFDLTAMEHSITPVKINNITYNAGLWLKLFDKPNAIPIGEVNIPIPLRSFPKAPHLERQYAEDLANPSETNANKQLEDAEAWSLNSDYSHDYVAQDTVVLKVEINQSDDQQSSYSSELTKPEKMLLESLISFKTIYPKILQTFTDNKLSAKTSPVKKPETSQSDLYNALDALSTLVRAVANNSDRANLSLALDEVGGPVLQSQLIPKETSFQITEGPVSPQGNTWNATISLADGETKNDVGILPQLMIPGYETELTGTPPSDPSGPIIYKFKDNNGNYLQADTAEGLVDRTVSIAPYDYETYAGTPLNIFFNENGLISMQIIRNESLPPAFQYQTPMVSYKKALSPLLDTNASINMAGLGISGGQPTKRSLKKHLLGFFNELLQVNQAGTTVAGSFQAVVYLSNPINSDLKLTPISIPMAFRLPTGITYGSPPDGTPSYVTNLAGKISNWFQHKNLASFNNAYLLFDVSLYTGSAVEGQPILKLRNIQLPINKIKNL